MKRLNTKEELLDFLAAAIEAAKAAGNLIRINANRAKKTKLVSAHDIKLDLDIQCQEAIENQLLKRFPSITVVGEEGVRGTQVNHFRWVVDPIDGTVNYFHGIPHAGVSIALQERVDSSRTSPPDREIIPGCTLGKPTSSRFSTTVGVIYDPFQDELWTAVVGDRSRLNGKPVSVNHHSQLRAAIISMGFGKHPVFLKRALPLFGQLCSKAQKVRILGSASLALA
ncbi:MAG: inositol monophosphatase, partial [Verrucomicrobiae bacterium]|nr:inositol monophosphatase [Verrucomicrobiae bacterium]